MNNFADLVLLSGSIFNALDDQPYTGYVAIKDDKILETGPGSAPEKLTNTDTKIIDLGNSTISPGFIDVHCFFSGYVIRFLGTDLQECKNEAEVFEKLAVDLVKLPDDQPVFGHDLNFAIQKETLDEKYPDRAVVLFQKGCETCSMNSEAQKRFNFTPDRCYPEAYVRIFPYVLGNKDFIEPQFIDYMRMMNPNGVTSIKEMGFDDYYSFTDTLRKLRDEEKLSVRVNFMSQPVAEPMDLEYGKRMREAFHDELVTFSGYNQMTDGSVSEYCADLKEPYLNTDFCCKQQIDWEKLEEDAIRADAEGFRFSLHAQGDAAISKTLDIYEKCQRDDQGRVINRQAITDLEFSDPKDLERMGKLGVIAEIYPQIQSIAQRENKIAMINEKIGPERGRYYWNRRKMAQSSVTISCGTDLPLLIDNIPESVYHACGAFFPEGGEPFNADNTLTLAQLLKAWTAGGAYNLGKEDLIGTIEAGKKADLAILSGDIFNTAIADVRKLNVIMTIMNGKIVYTEENNND